MRIIGAFNAKPENDEISQRDLVHYEWQGKFTEWHKLCAISHRLNAIDFKSYADNAHYDLLSNQLSCLSAASFLTIELRRFFYYSLRLCLFTSITRVQTKSMLQNFIFRNSNKKNSQDGEIFSVVMIKWIAFSVNVLEEKNFIHKMKRSVERLRRLDEKISGWKMESWRNLVADVRCAIEIKFMFIEIVISRTSFDAELVKTCSLHEKNVKCRILTPDFLCRMLGLNHYQRCQHLTFTKATFEFFL